MKVHFFSLFSAFSPFLFNCFLLLSSSSFSTAFGSGSKLDKNEVNALRAIGQVLGKTDWDFEVDPCSGDSNWNQTYNEKGFESSVICDCNISTVHNATCHVVSISLKAQNLSGHLPLQLHELRFLRVLDLSRNILSGSVPSQWGTMRLEELYLMGNKLSGPFPMVLTNITTLRNLSIEGNRFSGHIPPQLGNLSSLQKLVISSNQFTGYLPTSLAKLTNLTDMRMSDNSFSGRIPDFIRNWTVIEKLHIQGSSLEGPIPGAISELKSLTDLRISDLRKRASGFPELNKMSLRTLILRNCLLQGKIPEYISHMKKLKQLDLSFNNLTGEVPGSFDKLTKVDFLFLTGNKLTGAIPSWILGRNKNVDISYNKFTLENSSSSECPQGTVNLVESYSSSVNKIEEDPCIKKNSHCPGTPSPFLYINCGGPETSIGETKYVADPEKRGASQFYAGNKWAFSSTGNFMDNDADADNYIETNTSSIFNVSGHNLELYKTARVSPLSLTYYGLCLMPGAYTVKLHFAEIIFRNDGSFYRLGERIFDVYIQGKLVLKDFNIEDEAGGPGKPIVKNFTAMVKGSTLAIRFYWAGKGTQGIPFRGVYGPLISAISVDPNFKVPPPPPPPPTGHKKVSITLVGVVAASSLIILIGSAILWWKGCLGGKKSTMGDFKNLDTQTGSFSLRQIKAATKNFDQENKIGEGGFGSVYKGLLSDGTIVAVKQLSSKSKQGSREFINEIGMISALQHPNLVKLYGCCVEGNQLLLVYEYMENNCLSRALFGDNATRLKLDWATRQKICLGIARGLAYLHEESIIKIVHRDIKTSNVLLDKDLHAKISDFGLAKLNNDGDTHISTRIAGTVGYMAPEYAMRGYLTDKADVYSFGVVALEIVSGKSNTNYRPKEECVYLLDQAYVLQERGTLLELVDPNLGSEFSTEEAMVMLNVALLCTNASPSLRPTMTQVVSMLEGRTNVQDLLSDPGFSTTNPKIKALRNHFWQIDSPIESISTTGPLTDASVPKADKDDSRYLLRVGSLVST